MESGRSTPTLKRKSSSLPSTSSESSAGPQTPTSAEHPLKTQPSTYSHASFLDDCDTPFSEFGLGLGLLSSDSTAPSELSNRTSTFDDGGPVDEPPLYRRFSTTSRRSTIDASFPLTRHSESSLKSQQYPAQEAPCGADLSFEMQLDSLHFSELSFDADTFLVDNGR